MRDRRSVDDLSIEELEQILRIRKREARLQRLQRFERIGRRAGAAPLQPGDPDAPADEEPDLDYESFLQRGRLAWRSRSLRDQLLLLVEVVAIGGLVAILVMAASSLREINREAASVQSGEIASLPTASPTPLISVVVLPGGHTPPTAPEGAQPNFSEVPDYLKPLVEQQFAGPVIVPTAGPSVAIRLRIPALNVDAPIVQGDGWEQLKKGVGQHIGSADPGQAGNLVLSAHNDIYGEIFRHLDQLVEGDELIVGTLSREYVYRVDYWRIVPPTQVDVMAPTRESIVTLISCYPYMVNSDRIVVVGELMAP